VELGEKLNDGGAKKLASQLATSIEDFAIELLCVVEKVEKAEISIAAERSSVEAAHRSIASTGEAVQALQERFSQSVAGLTGEVKRLADFVSNESTEIRRLGLHMSRELENGLSQIAEMKAEIAELVAKSHNTGLPASDSSGVSLQPRVTETSLEGTETPLEGTEAPLEDKEIPQAIVPAQVSTEPLQPQPPNARSASQTSSPPQGEGTMAQMRIESRRVPDDIRKLTLVDNAPLTTPAPARTSLNADALEPSREQAPGTQSPAPSQNSAADAQLRGSLELTVAPVPDFRAIVEIDYALAALQQVKNVAMERYSESEVSYRLDLARPMKKSELAEVVARAAGGRAKLEEASEGRMRIGIAG
jgi:hypothetical protein